MRKTLTLYYFLGCLTLLQSCQYSMDNKPVLVNLDKDVDNSDFRLKLESETLIYRLGEKPTIQVKLFNKSGKTVNFLTSLDGSSEKMRYPHAGFKVFRNDTLIIPLEYLRCGNMDGISQKCKITLNDKSFFDPQNQAPWVYQDRTLEDSTIFSKVGNYEIFYYYSTDQDTLSEWLGWNVNMQFHSLEKKQYDSLLTSYQKFFQLVPRVDILSEPLKIEIK